VVDAQQNITAFWSMVAPGYEAHGGNVPEYGTPLDRAWADEIEALVPPAPTDALDLATGTGFVALILAARGHRVTAIDLSDDMLELAAATATNRKLEVRFLSGDAVLPAFDEASFDLITCRHLLWTLREPDRALARWLALLRPGGTLAAFDGFWFDTEPGPRADEPEPFRRHYTAETRAALPFMHIDRADPIVSSLERAGFVDVKVRQQPHLTNAPDATVPYVISGVRP
jgi:ubiquinone/menaquinone biosynthesis C-methylase UbiE